MKKTPLTKSQEDVISMLKDEFAKLNEKAKTMAVKKKYDLLSPDGFSIERDVTYSSKKAVKEAFEKWKKRYESQGYYSSNYGRIDLKYLAEECSLVEV
jgi:hypothetical protein